MSAEKKQSLRVGVLGTGDVGNTLATGFVKKGHSTILAGREENEKVSAWVKAQGSELASGGNFAKAVRDSDVIVLAVNSAAIDSAIQQAGGAAAFRDKLVIDAQNNITFAGGRCALASDTTRDSVAEKLQRTLPEAKLVKAFNTVGFGEMVDPKFADGKPDMFICGNDAGAKRIVVGILDQFGWGAVDMGPVEHAREIEALAPLWINYAMTAKSRHHAFKLLRK